MSEQPKALQIASVLDGGECCQAHGGQGCHPSRCEDCPRTTADELRRLHALNAELAAALKMLQAAANLPSHANAEDIIYTRPLATYEPSYQGGICQKHDQYYGGSCSSCTHDMKLIKERADRDAVRARDDALRSAEEQARAALANHTKESA